MNDKLWTRNFILLCLSNLLMCLAFYFLLPTLPVYLENILLFSKTSIGIVLAAFTVSALIVRPFIGVAIDFYNKKSIFIMSCFLFCLFFVPYLFTTYLISFIILRFIHGIAWGALTIGSSTLVVDSIPLKRRGEGIGLFGLSMTIAMSIGPFIGLFIVDKNNYQSLFLIAIIVAFMGLIITFFIKQRHYKPQHSFELKLEGLFERSAINLTFNVTLLMTTYGALVSYISIYAKEIKTVNAGIFFFIFAVGVGISRGFAGKIFDKRGPVILGRIGIGLLVFAFPILAYFKTVYGFYVSAFMLGLGNGIVFPVFQTMVNNLASKERRGAANSTLFTGFDLGIGVGIFIVGVLSENIGLTNSFFIAGIVNFIALVYFVFISVPHYNDTIKIN